MRPVPMSARLLACTVLAFASATASAQSRPAPQRDLGKTEFEQNCASCHGMQGKGDGVLKPFLNRSAPDLSILARSNGGVLPVARIYNVINGSQEATVHGTSDMPVWGNEYRMRAAEYYGEFPYDPEAFVRARVLALVDYIARLQAR